MVVRLTRRELLRLGAAAGAALALPACGGEAGGGAELDDGGTEVGPDDAGPAVFGPDAAPVETFGPRPYYVVGHNPNTIGEVLTALAAGANGLEPDINVYGDGSGRLCISHGEGAADAPTLEAYLTELREVALANPQLALIVFDCKSGACSPANGQAILTAIRTHLTHDTDLNIIMSVSGFGDAVMFDAILDQLGPREGLMIDEDNDPSAVSEHFTALGVTNQGFGNGISVLSCGILGPNVRPSMEMACGLRALDGRLRFIYVWTVDCVDLEEEYIRIGVDGMITNDPAEVCQVVARFPDVVRMATRADNPFLPANFAYALVITTGDVIMGGTDSNVTFTLTGERGSVSKTIDTSYIKRKERGDTNYLTLQSDDLGPLQSITVSKDNAGNGPDWFLVAIQVGSARFGAAAMATFDQWIDDSGSSTQPLVPV